MSGKTWNTLIVQPGEPAISETFLAAQAENLPGEVRVAHCETITCLDGEPILNQRWVARGWRKARRSVLRQSWEDQETNALAEAIRRCRADVVLAQYGPTGVRALPVCREAGVPLVVHFHGYDATRERTLERFGREYREMFHYASAIVVVSSAMRDQLESLGCPSEKLCLNPYGTDTRRFQGAAPSSASPHFVAVGRLVEKKAPHLTMLAFSAVKRDIPEATLTIIGDGPLMGVCQDLRAALHLNDSVRLLGAQPHPIVQREMASARAFVQHSVRAADGDCEGTPVAIIEACATGLPVVATRHAGIPDVVLEEKTGLLVEERDVDGMAAAWLRLARDAKLAGSLGSAGRARAAEHYELKKSVHRLGQLLGEVARHQSSKQVELETVSPCIAGVS